MAEEGGASAASLKEEGNAKFKAAQYAEAVEAYTRSLELDSSQHLCFSNRSAAHLKLEAAAEALRDAERCVELEPAWPKGYSRQAAALQELKRWEAAAAACEAGLKASGGDDALKKMLAEVRNRHLQERLGGLWSGCVSEVLGGYEQEMEFVENSSSVRVGVLGRSVVGRYWTDCSQEPNHLNIQVPMQEMPGMPPPPPPPPVPYICRIDAQGLHLCCPFMTMERPLAFDGPGYCLMARGGLATSPEDEEVSTMSTEEKLMACTRELIKTLPESLLQEVSQSDSEETTREKLMAQVKFESCMFAVQKRFGEEVMKEVLGATRPDSPVSGPLKGTKELEQLLAKLRACGICPEPEFPAPPPKPSPKIETKKAAAQQAPPRTEPEKASSQPAPKETATEEPASAPGASCGPAVLVPVVLAAAAAVAVMMYVRRPRS